MSSEIPTSPHIVQKILKRESPTGKVLSVYLDTSVQRAADKAYLLAQRDGCRAIRPTLAPEDLPSFEASVAQVETYLTDTFVADHPGLAIFASGSPEYFYVIPLAVSIEDRVDWETQPRIGPLELAVEQGERFAVALVDIQRARLFTISAGVIEERRILDDYVTGKHSGGGWAALNETKSLRHREELIRHHIERTIEELEALHRDHPFRRLLVGGPVEAASLLRNELRSGLKESIAGTIELEVFAGDAEILQSSVAAIKAIERRDELALVTGLLADKGSPSTVIGIDSVVYALGDDRVQRLVIASQLKATGVECTSCGRLAGHIARCPRCGATVEPVADLAERAIECALSQRSEMVIVTDEAADRLLAAGGIAAVLRY